MQDFIEIHFKIILMTLLLTMAIVSFWESIVFWIYLGILGSMLWFVTTQGDNKWAKKLARLF
jgi:hypothetical protein